MFAEPMFYVWSALLLVSLAVIFVGIILIRRDKRKKTENKEVARAKKE
jgi:heme exporter protein D